MFSLLQSNIKFLILCYLKGCKMMMLMILFCVLTIIASVFSYALFSWLKRIAIFDYSIYFTFILFSYLFCKNKQQKNLMLQILRKYVE